ncbi:MAG TPA: MarR family transcriptional regulator [Lachnoclostridium sp.]|uniref:MarR family winged helix-turn-helix transcriptional regulator n=1 Tax=Lacrimispora sp. TaxID=2719234 RepID=UPI000ECF0F49|nr:helix-turn-helix domain-containing protein [Lacrimispora sp.]HCD42182.1 MarR family transcriptional regulator [Lachnoclostridium sp.]
MDDQIKKQQGILNQHEKELTAIYRSAAIKSGISDSELWVWYALLVLGGEYSQQNICDIWSLPKQTVNSVIANLTKKGYVFLETVPGTRNRKIIRLTEAGKEFGENKVLHIYEAEQRAIEKMPEQELKTFIALMGKYITLLREEINKE